MLTPADEIHHINKHNFKVPFVCGCRDLGEALRRIAEGAAMIRTKVGDLVLTAAGELALMITVSVMAELGLWLSMLWALYGLLL